MRLLEAYLPLFEIMVLHAGFACAQYVVLKAGVFSVATAGLAALGAYCAAILNTRLGLGPVASLAAATLLGGAASALLAWPLARLRGVYQAIATLAFVQIVLSLNLFAEGLTGGAMGLNNIPRSVGLAGMAAALAATVYLLAALGRGRIGRAFEAIREDEAMAVSLGISVTRHQALAFVLAGLIAGLFGGLEALHRYALDPNQFGFGLVVAVLSYVVLGGRRSVAGPLVGTVVLVALPELVRPLADLRMLIYGVLLILVMAYLPRGVADTLGQAVRRRRLRHDPAGDKIAVTA